MLDPCPYLPESNASMNWRSMKSAEGVQFYMTALAYSQLLWEQNLPARAILAVDRALLTNMSGNEPELVAWPLPYRAMSWMVANYDEAVFVGNPRVHFQHLATRVKGEREDQRRWRAWATLIPGAASQTRPSRRFQTGHHRTKLGKHRGRSGKLWNFRGDRNMAKRCPSTGAPMSQVS